MNRIGTIDYELYLTIALLLEYFAAHYRKAAHYCKLIGPSFSLQKLRIATASFSEIADT